MSVDDHTGQIGNRQHLGAAIESSGTGDSLPRRNWAGEDRAIEGSQDLGFFQPLHGQVEILLSTLDIVLRQTVIGLAVFVFFLGYQVVFKKLSIVLKYASYLLELQLGCINLSLLLLDFNADVLVVQCKE